MTIAQMRQSIKNVYGDFVRCQPVDGMPDAQVVAFYKSLVGRGVFDRNPEKIARGDVSENVYVQLSFFDNVVFEGV